MKKEICPYQKKHGETCTTSFGNFCQGRPELKYCKPFIVHDLDLYQHKQNSYANQIIWASDKAKANQKYNVGILQSKNNMIHQITEIKLPKSLIKKLEKRFD